MGSTWLRGAPAIAVGILVAACELGRDRPTMPVLGDLSVTSDPSGAEIFVDNRSTGSTTPATVPAAAGQRAVRLALAATGPWLFEWTGSVVVPETMQVNLDAALQGGCLWDCPFRIDANRVGCAVTSAADLCSAWGSPSFPGRNAWPTGSGNEYVYSLRPMVGTVVGTDGGGFAGDTVSSFLYQTTWLGRSAVSVQSSSSVSTADYLYWSNPSGSFTNRIWLLGIAVDQTVVQPSDATFPELQDVVYVRFELTNVTGDPRYRHYHPEIPEGGWTYTQLYAGIALDADIGASDDDSGTYLPDSVAFLYDLNFQDAQLAGGYDTKPPLVGIVRVESPQLATRFPFSLWPSGTADWDADYTTLSDDAQGLGYRILTAQLGAGDPLTDCTGAGDEIGFCSDAGDDYRLAMTAGPLELPPGQSAVLVFALVFADPAPGFTSGSPLPPGLPTQTGRDIEAVADSLKTLAGRARAMWPQVSAQVP